MKKFSEKWKYCKVKSQFNWLFSKSTMKWSGTKRVSRSSESILLNRQIMGCWPPGTFAGREDAPMGTKRLRWVCWASSLGIHASDLLVVWRRLGSQSKQKAWVLQSCVCKKCRTSSMADLSGRGLFMVVVKAQSPTARILIQIVLAASLFLCIWQLWLWTSNSALAGVLCCFGAEWWLYRLTFDGEAMIALTKS